MNSKSYLSEYYLKVLSKFHKFKYLLCILLIVYIVLYIYFITSLTPLLLCMIESQKRLKRPDKTESLYISEADMFCM